MKQRCMSRCQFLGVLASIGGFAAAAQGASVDTLVLTSQAGGQYDYAVQLAPNHGLVFALGDQIALTGLSGVTGVSVLPGLSFCFSSGATTAGSAMIFSSTQCPVFDPVLTGVTIPALRIFSTVLTSAPVSYEIQTGSEGTLFGTVMGPLVVPEPGTGGLTAAIMALFVLGRWRFICVHRSHNAPSK
jgi:hypothetical protein